MIQFLLDGTNLINPAAFTCTWVGCTNYREHHGSPLKGRGAIEGAMGVNLRGGGAIVGVIGLHLRGGGYRGHHGSPFKGKVGL